MRRKDLTNIASEIYQDSFMYKNPKTKFLQALGNIINKHESYNYYEIEFDLIQLFKSLIHWVKQQNMSLEEFLKVLLPTEIQVKAVPINNFDTIIQTLTSLKHPAYVTNHVCELIEFIMTIDNFCKYYDGFESLKFFRSFFAPEEYERFWNGIPDTEYVYKGYNQCNSFEDWIGYFMKNYPKKVLIKE